MRTSNLKQIGSYQLTGTVPPTIVWDTIRIRVINGSNYTDCSSWLRSPLVDHVDAGQHDEDDHDQDHAHSDQSDDPVGQHLTVGVVYGAGAFVLILQIIAHVGPVARVAGAFVQVHGAVATGPSRITCAVEVLVESLCTNRILAGWSVRST